MIFAGAGFYGYTALKQEYTITYDSYTATETSFESEIASIDYISSSGGNVAYYTAACYVDVDGGVYPGMQVTVSIPQELPAHPALRRSAAARGHRPGAGGRSLDPAGR